MDFSYSDGLASTIPAALSLGMSGKLKNNLNDIFNDLIVINKALFFMVLNVNTLLGSDSILCRSDNVFDSGLVVRVGLLEQKAFSAFCARVACLDAMLRRLVAGKVFGVFLLAVIIYAKS